MKKIELKSRKLLRKIFGGISVTAVAFVFQACYGMQHDEFYDVRLTGTVTSKTTNLPIQGIKVTVDEESHNMGITNEKGRFDFYATVSDGRREEEGKRYQKGVSIHFRDIDGVKNGHFADMTITIDPAHKDEVKINVQMTEKQ